MLEEDAEDEREEDAFEVWPENVEAVELFCVLATQWRVVSGLAGERFFGLDYAAVGAVMAMRNVKRRDQARLLSDIRVMEGAALRELNRKVNG